MDEVLTGVELERELLSAERFITTRNQNGDITIQLHDDFDDANAHLITIHQALMILNKELEAGSAITLKREVRHV